MGYDCFTHELFQLLTIINHYFILLTIVIPIINHYEPLVLPEVHRILFPLFHGGEKKRVFVQVMQWMVANRIHGSRHLGVETTYSKAGNGRGMATAGIFIF